MNCIIEAWDAHEAELRAWLSRRLGERADADDLLQDVFLKALAHGGRFCQVDNARAWLFRVARNALADRLRRARETVELPDGLTVETDETAPVETLTQCLPRALAELGPEDREAIVRCDLNRMSQADYARHAGLSLSGAKSRVQRARRRLREHLRKVCRVRFDEAGQVCCFVPRDPSD